MRRGGRGGGDAGAYVLTTIQGRQAVRALQSPVASAESGGPVVRRRRRSEKGVCTKGERRCRRRCKEVRVADHSEGDEYDDKYTRIDGDT